MLLKEGMKVRQIRTEREYRVKWVGERIVALESENGCFQILTTAHSLGYCEEPNVDRISSRSLNPGRQGFPDDGRFEKE